MIKTLCFCFNPSITLDFQYYQCHFEDPQNGEMQAHKSFIIDSEVHLINHKFSQVYGILASIGYEIKFTESENSFVELLLAASSLNRNSQKDKEEIIICDQSKTTFHLIIALDCAGSMQGAITNIKHSLTNIVSVINSEFKNILILFNASRDYCDSNIIKKTLFVKQEDCKKIINAISYEMASGGGDEPEAHKTCLAEIKNGIEQYKKEMTNVCFFITDAPHLSGHSQTYQQEKKIINS